MACACAHHELPTEKADVVGAFLQNDATKDVREVYGLLPMSSLKRAILHIKGRALVQILKPVYCLTLAPRRWWQRVVGDV